MKKITISEEVVLTNILLFVEENWEDFLITRNLESESEKISEDFQSLMDKSFE